MVGGTPIRLSCSSCCWSNEGLYLLLLVTSMLLCWNKGYKKLFLTFYYNYLLFLLHLQSRYNGFVWNSLLSYLSTKFYFLSSGSPTTLTRTHSIGRTVLVLSSNKSNHSLPFLRLRTVRILFCQFLFVFLCTDHKSWYKTVSDQTIRNWFHTPETLKENIHLFKWILFPSVFLSLRYRFDNFRETSIFIL